MKLKVFKDYNLDPTGVEDIWVWECPHPFCMEHDSWFGQALYWTNIVRSASNHILWHETREI